MSLTKFIKALAARIADTPAARPITAVGASILASVLSKHRVSIFFDSVWLRRDGRSVVALGPKLRFRRRKLQRWRPNATDAIDIVGDWWFLHYHPQPNDVIIDVGAGTGEDTLLFSRLIGPHGLVYSFEAHPTTFGYFTKVLEYSECKNVIATQCAMFSTSGTLQIEDLPAERWEENSVVATERLDKNHSISVPAMALDDFEPVQKLDQIDFLKMNIEGAEIDALRGMPRTLKKVQYACIACHDFLAASDPHLQTKAVCKQILLDAGFAVFESEGATEPALRDHLHAVRT